MRISNTNYRRLAVIFLIDCLCFSQSMIGFAQTSTSSPDEEKISLTNCELTVLELDSIAQSLKDGVVIAIARLGDGERSGEISRRRLFNIRAYLTQYLAANKLGNQQVVTAQGERVRGLGRVELYVDGKLRHTFAISRNKDLIVGSCEGEKDIRFYPWYKPEK